MRRSTYGVWGWAIVFSGCSEVSDIEAIPCEPGCKDEATRIYCDAAGKAQTEVCPTSTEECAAPVCEAAACTFKPAVGAPCGETGGAQCNEGFACLGGAFHLSAILLSNCLATDDGKVWCWGNNLFQQLGDGPALNPVLVRGLPDHADQVSTGYAHTCALLRSGQIYCWGNNSAGQCGVPPSDPLSEPVLVDAPGVRFTSVATGKGHTCGIAEDKSVHCWGHNQYGQCGLDPEVAGIFADPTQVPGLDSVESIVTVKNHTCAVQSKDPRMSCWGSNTYDGDGVLNYKLGPASREPLSAIPKPVELDAPVIGAGMGFESTYALTEDGRVYAWGRNNRGQLGIQSGASLTPTSTPALVMIKTDAGLVPLTGVASINRSDGSDQCVTLREPTASGTRFMCWGADDWGEVGAGTEVGARTSHPFPIAVEALPPEAHALARGEDHGCGAVPVEGRTEIWCYGRPGALGNGTEPAGGDVVLPSQWEGTPVVWKPENFLRALAPAGE